MNEKLDYVCHTDLSQTMQNLVGCWVKVVVPIKLALFIWLFYIYVFIYLSNTYCKVR